MKKRYCYSKYVKSTGKLLEGRGFSKEVAKKRFKLVKELFAKRKYHGLWEVNTHGTDGKVWTRKELVGNYLQRLQEEDEKAKQTENKE